MISYIVFMICLLVMVFCTWNLSQSIYILHNEECDQEEIKLIKRNNTIDFILIVITFCVAVVIGVAPKLLNDSRQEEINYNKDSKTIIEEIEDERYNTDLPDGMYYLGVEIVEKTTYANNQYQYAFAVVDDTRFQGQLFIYVTESDLNMNVPYMLTMDDMGTKNDSLDDQIVVIWQNVQ